MGLFLDQLDGLKDGYALSKLPSIPDIGFWLVIIGHVLAIMSTFVYLVYLYVYACQPSFLYLLKFKNSFLKTITKDFKTVLYRKSGNVRG